MKCDLCGKEIKHLSPVQTKYRKKFASNMHLCKECLENFINSRHIEHCRCPKCGKEFEWYPSLRYRSNTELSSLTSILCRDCFRIQGYEKRESTMISKYGVKNPSQSKEVQDKRKKTFEERYGEGIINPTQIKKVQEKIKENNIRKYGVTNPNKLRSVREKVEKTNLERYGVKCTLSSKEIQEKIKQTNIEKYGVENVSMSSKIQEKIKTTFIEHYGESNPMRVPHIREKVKSTTFQNNGVYYPLQNESSREKFRKTCLEHFGIESPLSSDIVKQKSRETCLQKYGVPYSMMVEEVRKKSQETNIEKYGVAQVMHNPEIRGKIARSAKTSKLEKKVAEMLKNRGIIFQSQYVIRQNNHTHAFDFGIFNEENKLVALVDTDGLFYHAYLGDSDAKMQRDDYDFIRTYCIPEGVKFIVIFEKHIEEGFRELLSILKISYDEYIEDVFEWCRSIEFPWYHYADWELKKSYEKLVKYSKFSYGSRIGGRILRHFHRSILTSHRDGCISPYEGWMSDNILLKCIKNRFIYVNNLEPSRVLEGLNISKLAPKVSVFSPTRAKTIVTKYLNEFSSVFDPFSGFSGRMLGVCALGKKYIGQDINQQIVQESNQIIEFLGLEKQATVVQKDVLESTGEYECLFTCSPYSSKEIWGKETIFKTCDEWIDECLSRFSCSQYVFVVDKTEKYKEFIQEEIVNKSHFGKNTELIIIINKNNA